MLASVLGMALSIEFGIASTYALGVGFYGVCAAIVVASRRANRTSVAAATPVEEPEWSQVAAWPPRRFNRHADRAGRRNSERRAARIDRAHRAALRQNAQVSARLHQALPWRNPSAGVFRLEHGYHLPMSFMPAAAVSAIAAEIAALTSSSDICLGR